MRWSYLIALLSADYLLLVVLECVLSFDIAFFTWRGFEGTNFQLVFTALIFVVLEVLLVLPLLLALHLYGLEVVCLSLVLLLSLSCLMGAAFAG